MKMYIIILSLILFCGYSMQRNTTPFSPKEISGNYKGYTSQDIYGKEIFFKTLFKLKVNKGGTVKGQSTFYDSNDSTQVLVVYKFEGKYEPKKQELFLKEYEIIQKNKEMDFCFKEMPFMCVEENNLIELRGTWTAKNCPGTGGKIRIIKQK